MDNFFKKNHFFLISLGAIPAAILRWQVDQIYIVNIIGCFLLGLINNLNIPRKYKLIFGFGFCGSLTTFSGWSFQLFKFISQRYFELFFLNLISIIIFSFLAMGLGHLLAEKINV